uniref:Uncharacterized protein n=1 Tax=Arundo donax TaxID=35708 RepID=A0A0A9GUH4_ARUDO
MFVHRHRIGLQIKFEGQSFSLEER